MLEQCCTICCSASFHYMWDYVYSSIKKWWKCMISYKWWERQAENYMKTGKAFSYFMCEFKNLKMSLAIREVCVWCLLANQSFFLLIPASDMNVYTKGKLFTFLLFNIQIFIPIPPLCIFQLSRWCFICPASYHYYITWTWQWCLEIAFRKLSFPCRVHPISTHRMSFVLWQYMLCT